MKDEKSAPPIAEAVSFLGSFAPDALARLKNELPDEIQPLLVPGGVAGPLPITLKSRASVQLTALKQITERISKAITTAEGRLKTAKRVRLIGDIAAVLGSSSVLAGSASVGSTQATPSSITIVTSGIIALLGALAGVLSEYAIRLPEGGGGSLFEVYSGLGEARFEAEVLIGEIESLLTAEQNEDVEKPLSAALGAANTLCRKVQKTFAQILQNA